MHIHVRIQAIYEELLIWLILLVCAWLSPALYYFACLHDYILIFILYKWLDNRRTYWFTFYVFPFCLCFCTLFFSCCLLGACKNSLWLKVPQSKYDPWSLIYSGGMHGSLWHMGCHTNCHIQTCVCGSIHLVQACMYMVHVHMSCSLHYIKSKETRGVKMFPTETSRDVGMVTVSDAAARKNQLVEKVQEQGGVFRDIVAPGQHSPSKHILWIHFLHPYIWQHFDVARRSVRHDFFPPVVFFHAAASDTVHHPYTSTCFCGKHFYTSILQT